MQCESRPWQFWHSPDVEQIMKMQAERHRATPPTMMIVRCRASHVHAQAQVSILHDGQMLCKAAHSLEVLCSAEQRLVPK